MPGLFVKATVVLSNTDELLVPQRATTRQPDGSIVVMTVNASDKVEPRQITVSGAWQDQYMVKGGVQAGDRVIVTGYQKVQPGMQVNAKPWQAGNAQAKNGQ